MCIFIIVKCPPLCQVLSVVSRLQFLKDIPQLRILCCGGDGTVGWLLEAMGGFSYIDIFTFSFTCIVISILEEMYLYSVFVALFLLLKN